MTVSSIQARMQMIESRFEPNSGPAGSVTASSVAGADFRALLEQAERSQDGLHALGAASRTGLGSNPTTSSSPFAILFEQQLASARDHLAGFQTTVVSQGVLDGPAEIRYQELFEQAGLRHDIDPALLAAVASVESGFDPTAQSPAGAQGLMQFMPATAAEMGVDPFDPASAIDGAARYLKREIQRFGSIELAAAAYNAGAGAVSRHGGIPPFTETRNYVTKVLSAYEARQ